MQEALLTIFPLIVLYAALSDMFTMTITNRTTLLLAICFFPLAFAVGLGFEDIAWHLAAGILTLAIGIALFSFGFIGGGDAKLFAAISLWLGWGELYSFALLSALFGGGLTILILYMRRFLSDSAFIQNSPISMIMDRSKGIPYGIALSAAGLMLYQESVWFHQLVQITAG